MKKLLLALIGFSIISFGTSASVAADVNDFTITNYDIALTLSKDDEGRSRLVTKETITAVFPETDQNRGIERYIPRNYDGHSTSLAIESAVDGDGNKWNYTTYTSGDYEVMRIGDADRYVHGKQVYTITYSQRDVTRSFADTGRDELYWDTNGTEWRVPIQNLTVTTNIDSGLTSAFTGDVSCYQGSLNSTDDCNIERNGSTITTSARNLAPGENITLALGFEPDTFTGYVPSTLERVLGIWLIAQVVLTIVSIGLIIFFAIRYSAWSRRKHELGTVIPEYLPPKDASVSLSATILPTQSSFSAQLIDFAVRHYVKIYETKPAGFLSTAVYEIEIIKAIDDLRTEEKEFLKDVFANKTQIGTKIDTKQMQKDYKLATRLSDNPKKLETLIRNNYGLQHKDSEKSAWFKKMGIGLLIVSILFLSPALLIAAITALIMSSVLWVFTDRGLTLYRYLSGLKMYISVAEAERLKMLQSPDGAEKVNVDGADEKKLVTLYEKVLPYAILFGYEKQWNKQIGEYYQSTGTQPDWYTGTNVAAFNAIAFSSAMNNLTTSINSSGAASSSSGGSSGGGYSGGGGGGGGGGGW